MAIQYDHEQVPFVTLDGREVTVDIELYEILMELKDLGVRTLFSCQDNHGQGYILAESASFNPVFKTVKRRFIQNAYSEVARSMVSDFAVGRTEREFALHSKGGSYRFGSVRLNKVSRARRYRLLSGNLHADFIIEYIVDNRYGRRTCIRWPSTRTDDLLTLVQETR